MKKKLWVSVVVVLTLAIVTLIGCSAVGSLQSEWEKGKNKTASSTIEVSGGRVSAGNFKIVNDASLKVVIDRHYIKNKDGTTDMSVEVILSNVFVSSLIMNSVAEGIDKEKTTFNVKLAYNTGGDEVAMEFHGYNYDGVEDTNPENRVGRMNLSELVDVEKGGKAEMQPFVDFFKGNFDAFHLYDFEDVKFKANTGISSGTFDAKKNASMQAIFLLIKNYMTAIKDDKFTVSGKELTIAELQQKISGEMHLADYFLAFVNLGEVKASIDQSQKTVRTTQDITGYVSKTNAEALLKVVQELNIMDLSAYENIISAVLASGIDMSIKVVSRSVYSYKNAKLFSYPVEQA